MLTCTECGGLIEEGRAHVERIDAPDDEGATPELAFFCAACAQLEFKGYGGSPGNSPTSRI